MRINRGDIVLPSVDEAVETIRRFAELEAGNVDNFRTLASALGGMSEALSAVALDYGEDHRLPDIQANIGTWTVLDGEDEKHKFTADPQDIFGYTGAHLWRSAVVGGPDRYYDHVNVPTQMVLESFLATDPAQLRQGWHQPSWTDIYAERIRDRDRGLDEGVFERHWPFHMPVSRPEGYPTTAAEDAIRYTQTLQGLSLTLLDVVGQPGE